jgi:hypothetical protein
VVVWTSPIFWNYEKNTKFLKLELLPSTDEEIGWNLFVHMSPLKGLSSYGATMGSHFGGGGRGGLKASF